MDKIKYDAIKDYLQGEFPDSQIEQTIISDDPHYGIHIVKGMLMLRVGRMFIDDNVIEAVIERMKYWDVPDLLRKNSTVGVLVASDGTSTFERS